MRKKKIIKLETKEEHNKLIELFSLKTPEERQILLTNIDIVLCTMLDLDSDDLPWLNPNQHTVKWEKIMKKLRLIIGKIEYESRGQNKRTVH